MSRPTTAKFLGPIPKDASDEEIAAWLQRAIAEAKKAKIGAGGSEVVPKVGGAGATQGLAAQGDDPQGALAT